MQACALGAHTAAACLCLSTVAGALKAVAAGHANEHLQTDYKKLKVLSKVLHKLTGLMVKEDGDKLACAAKSPQGRLGMCLHSVCLGRPLLRCARCLPACLPACLALPATVQFQLAFLESPRGQLVQYTPGSGARRYLPSFLCSAIEFDLDQAPMFTAKLLEALHAPEDADVESILSTPAGTVRHATPSTVNTAWSTSSDSTGYSTEAPSTVEITPAKAGKKRSRRPGKRRSHR